MRKYVKFQTWCLSLVGFLGFYYYLFELEILKDIAEKDSSRLAFIIMGIHMLGHLLLGKYVYRDDVKKQVVTDKQIDIGFEVSEHLLAIGMMGTVIGFIIMATSLAKVRFDDIQNVGQLFTIATHGMSTAFYATVVGLICSILLRVSFYAFDYSKRK